MSTVAIIGADGAGKTTIAKMIPNSCPVATKYLYMGPNIESSNIALPTSRLILFLKLESYKRTARRKGITDPNFISTHHNAHRKVERGSIGATLRLLNRLAEGLFRQFISWSYQLRGFVVIYDRYFLFDAASSNEKKHRRITDRIYYWILDHLFPHPDMVIFLDAPAEILFARKGEGSIDYLERKREICIEQGKKMRKFIRVDATQPVEKVLDEVNQHITAFNSPKKMSHEIHRTEA